MQCLEVAFRRTRPQRRPNLHRPRDALEVLGPKVLQLEEIAEKPSRVIGDDDHVRLGQGLQARRKIRRLADDRLLLCSTRADQITDHDQPGRDADTGLQGSVMLERTDRTNQLQPHAIVDSKGRPLNFTVTGGQVHDSQLVGDVLDTPRL